MKKRISVMLICLLIFSILPIQEFLSFAVGFEPNDTIEYGDGSLTSEQLNIVEGYLNELGVDLEDQGGIRLINYKIFYMYGIVAYGYPSTSDYKLPKDFPELKRTEYRYLGYDYTGEVHITNNDFPSDATTPATNLPNKNWITDPNNLNTWKVAGVDDELKQYIYTTKSLINDGAPLVPDYSISDILASKSSSQTYKEDYITLQAIPKFSVNGSVRLRHRTLDNKVWYDSFTIPSFKGKYDLEVIVSTSDSIYTILPTESYIDIPVTVTLNVTVEEDFLESFIKTKSVTFEGITQNEDTYTYTKRIYKSSLSEGDNPINLTGQGSIQSGFPNDNPITKTGSKPITVRLAQDNLIAQLSVPQTGAINTSYMVKDVSYIPQGATIISSTLEKKVGYGSFEEVSSWNGSHITEIHPVKTTITYRLNVTLDNGQTGTDTKAIQILDSRSVDATADLRVTPITYEGHPAYANDESVFDIEGESYFASRAYEEGLAENEFDVVESTPHSIDRLNDTTAKLTFQNKGYYNVRLDIFTQDGKNLFDIEPIEVRKTPYIIHNLGGTQKENRKQVLNLSVAIKPSTPITNFWVEIEDTDTGEKVHLSSTKVNITNIKTRDIISSSSTYYQNYTLEFLTKNTTEKVYKYTAYVRDFKGDTDTVSETFTVYPDLPPTAQIDMLDSFIRNQDSNIATVLVEDGTICSDGDQIERTWSIRRDINNNGTFDATESLEPMSAYNMQDLSFGTGQKVSFEHTGVGKVRVRLDVKEVWVEPTLEEYVTDADRKTGAVVKNTEVNNIAPTVSLESLNTYPVDISFITSNGLYNATNNTKNYLDGLLKENGIDSKIKVKNLDEIFYSADASTARSRSYAIGRSDWSVKALNIDNDYNYSVRPSNFTNDGSKQIGVAPYIVQAFNNSNQSLAWSYTTNEANFKILLEKTKQLVFIVCSNKTLILNRNTGAYLGTIYFVLEGDTYYQGTNIYIFKENEIKRYNTVTGQMTVLKTAGSSITKVIKGKVEYVAVDSKQNRVFRGKFDLETEEETREYINFSSDIGGGASLRFTSSYEIMDMDILGNVLIRQLVLYVDEGRITPNSGYVHVISPDNTIKLRTGIPLYDHVRSSNLLVTTKFITNEAGKAEYFFYSYRGRTDVDQIALYVCNINTGQVYDYTSYWLANPFEIGKKITNMNLLRLFANGNFSQENGFWPRSSYETINLSNMTGNFYQTSFADMTEQLFDSDLYYSKVYDSSYNYDNYQHVQVYQYPQYLKDSLTRAVQESAGFRKGFQKYIVIMDSQFHHITESMPDIVNLCKKEGIKIIYVGGNTTSYPNSYGKQLVSQVGGHMITYSGNMTTNMNNIFNVINSNKAIETYVGKGQTISSGQSWLNKGITLEPSTTYRYEYDIEYGTTYGNANANRFYLGHNYVDNPGYGIPVPTIGSIANTAYLIDVLFEDFQDNISHPMLSFSPVTDSYTFGIKNGVYGGLMYGYYSSFFGEGTITIKMEKNGFVSFDYFSEIDVYGGNSIEIYVDEVLKYSRAQPPGIDRGNKTYYLSQGIHTLRLKGVYNNSADYPPSTYLDNLKIQYINRTSGIASDTGVMPAPIMKYIEKDKKIKVKGTFKTPGSVTRLDNIPGGAGYLEDLNDGALDGFVVFPNSFYKAKPCFYLENGHGHSYSGRYNSNNNYPETAEALFDIYANIPEGSKATISFDIVDTGVGQYRKDPNIYYYEKAYDDWDYVYYLVRGATTGKQVSSAWQTISIPAKPGWNKFYINKSYEHDYYGSYLSDVYIDNIKVSFDAPYETPTEKYFKAQSYNGSSWFSLLFSEITTPNMKMSNLKVYKTEDSQDYLVLEEDFIDPNNINTKWAKSFAGDSTVSFVKESKTYNEDDPVPMIYKKGQLVAYNIYYDDYESDPSKTQYWEYTHTPFNDGIHPSNGQILNSSIDRFYVDGKYVVRHWQEDNTGVTSYDKNSNVQEITFYVQGNAVAPEVTYIKTVPDEVIEGNNYQIEIGVDDQDKDILNTTIELYKNGSHIYSYTRNNVAPISGVYPPIISGYAPTATPGKYTIVATASDSTGIGLRSCDFIVVSQGRIEGKVSHTDQWNQNRIRYNLSKSGTENSPRPYNVFWSGEAFILRAETQGYPTSVDVEILSEGYNTSLSSTDQILWTRELWVESMVNKWGKETPETLVFRFTANFSSGITRTDDIPIIVDNRENYWQLHRLY